MPETKRIVCLANSRKPSGRCIAGREIVVDGLGGWIRPVSARPGEEVSEDERRYEDGTDPKVLDVIDVPLVTHRPHACQTENWLLDPSQYWQRVRRSTWEELQPHVENPPTLWLNRSSTFHGAFDEVEQTEADSLTRSLYLIRVPNLALCVFAPSKNFGNPERRVQARFKHADVAYALWVTDPIVEREFLAKSDERSDIGEACLTVSLGEPFEKQGHGFFRNKLVAAIIRPGAA